MSCRGKVWNLLYLSPGEDKKFHTLPLQHGQNAPRNWRKGGYLDRLQQDPWGNDYVYQTPGRDGRLFDLYSYGADGRAGGTDNNADIGNWNLDQNQNSER